MRVHINIIYIYIHIISLSLYIYIYMCRECFVACGGATRQSRALYVSGKVR